MVRRNTVTSLVGMLVLALLLQQEVLTLLVVLMLLAIGLAFLWNRWVLRRFSYTRELSQRRAFPGDTVTLSLHLSNRKLLSIPGVHVAEQIPRGLVVSGKGVTATSHQRSVIRRSTDIRWYEQVTWRYSMVCNQRGAFTIGPARIESGDPFGFYEAETEIDAEYVLIVFPRLLPLEQLRLPAIQPVGTLQARALIRDPLRTVGVRDYALTDSLRDIHWNATARTGTLQTRIYEATTERSLAIFLDIDSFERYWEGIDPEQVERVISAAATVVQAASDEGYAVGLYTNGAAPEYAPLIALPPSRSPGHAAHVLESLARLGQLSVTPMYRLLQRYAPHLPHGATLLLISAIAPEDVQQALAAIRGRPKIWLFLGERAPSVPGVTMHHAPAAQSWRRTSQHRQEVQP